jgi:hypothetical protein
MERDEASKLPVIEARPLQRRCPIPTYLRRYRGRKGVLSLMLGYKFATVNHVRLTGIRKWQK